MAICSPLMIVAEIAHLTHAKRVDESVLVPAFSGLDISPKSTVAGTAKILGVVLSLGMLALGDLHRPSSPGREKWLRYFHLANCDWSNLPLDRDVCGGHRFGGGHLTRLPIIKFREVLFKSKVTKLFPQHVFHKLVLCFKLIDRQILGLCDH
jgi:hypothetical protein